MIDAVIDKPRTKETPAAAITLKTLAMRVTGDPLDPDAKGSFIKPAELVDAVENSAVAAIAATTPLPASDPGNDNLSCTRLVA